MDALKGLATLDELEAAIIQQQRAAAQPQTRRCELASAAARGPGAAAIAFQFK